MLMMLMIDALHEAIQKLHALASEFGMVHSAPNDDDMMMVMMVMVMLS